MQIAPENADTIANLIVLNTLLGKKDDVSELQKKLAGVQGSHKVLADWAEKKQEFERAKAKYTPKFEAAT